jgi:cob(I)alamin adenosyltransferase
MPCHASENLPMNKRHSSVTFISTSEESISESNSAVAISDTPEDGTPRVLDSISTELLILAKEVNRWGAANRRPSIRVYPQYARLRELGQALFDCGEYSAMDHGLAQIEEVPELHKASIARLIEFAWEDIEGWQA